MGGGGVNKQDDINDPHMIAPLLQTQLEPVARRYRRLQLWRGLAVTWLLAAVAGGAVLGIHQLTGWWSPLTLPLLAGAAVTAALMVWRATRKMTLDLRWIARQIEHEHPELHTLLLTAVEQQPPAGAELGYLQQRVIAEALAHSQNNQWTKTIAASRLAWAQAAHLLALGLLLAILTNLRHSETKAIAARLIQASITVTPGDTSIERGNSLVVLARFTGPLPAKVSLLLGSSAASTNSQSLVKSLDDPVFGGSLPEVTTDFVYHLEYAGERTRDFKVKVFEHPKLERSDIQLHYPTYTSQPDKRIPDTKRISAVEGSSLELSLQLNKPVVSAQLVARDKSVIPLLTDTNRAHANLKQFPLVLSQSYELHLVDAEGRTNKIPAQFVFDVLKNRPPELKMAAPRGDQRVSALEEISFQAEAWDDFGLGAHGIAYTPAGKETKFIELGQSAPAREKRALNYLLKLEELSAQPEQLISYFVWADDIGPDGKVRRTSSDMYFAEVRPFEEIYREGQAQEGEGGDKPPPGNQATKLAELQKQIINATWKLQRQETSTNASARYRKDAPVVAESQAQALDQAQALLEEAPNPRTQGLLTEVTREMKQAVARLAAATNSPALLPPALAAEQAAYQALLKLAAREYSVSQNRSRKGTAGEQANQQQLDQLDLKLAEDRYEKQREAESQKNPEQREQLQVLNRLRELAQRQQDVNERLKELQSALQEAKNEPEREEVRRRLKRLREEEQQMLADIDELKQRMDKAENQSRMAEARQQLEQTRSEVQKAAAAMDQGAVPQALTSGTRAQRDLQQLRDDFRKKNSNQFAEEMKQIRTDARELAQKQEEIGKKLDGQTENKRKSLVDSGDKQDLAKQLDEQKKRLGSLLDQATQLTEKAESVEPLLHKQLYDTLRNQSQREAKNLKETTDELLQSGRLTRGVYDLLKKATDEGGNKSLEVAAELLRGGNAFEAGRLEPRVRAGLEELKRGVERAAENVLGDETESLRMARKELDSLNDQLNQEMAQANPEAGAGGEKQGEKAGEQPGAAGAGGKPAQNEAKPDQPGGSPAGKSGEEPGKGKGKSASTKPGAAPSPDGNKPSAQTQPQPSASGQKGGGPSPGQANGEPNSTPGAPPPGGAQPGNRQAQRGGNSSADGGGGGGNERGGLANFLNNSRAPSGQGPIYGDDFGPWSDRLRNVEEMIDQPDLRNDVARVRERAREIRSEARKEGKKPDWAVVNLQISGPLLEIRNRVAEELARREGTKETLVPIDRDPVPNKFSELVRRYYEQLGSEK